MNMEDGPGQQPSSNDTLMRLDDERMPWVTVNTDKTLPTVYRLIPFLL